MMAISESLALEATSSPATTNPQDASPSSPPYQPAKFDPELHLCYEKPEQIITFDDLGLNPSTATSAVAITAPFPLLTAEGVRALRADIFREEVVSKYGSLKYPGVYRIRGYGPDAPFTYDLWRSEALRQACSAAAGTELDIIFDYEIGQLNVQLPASVDKEAPITENLPPPMPRRDSGVDLIADGHAAAEGRDGEPDQDGKQEKTTTTTEKKKLVSAWHNDSYPWVCVLMLSDPVGMRGGETALRKGDDAILKVRAPGMGYAVMMQGGSINHAALPCLGDGERITFVTSFRPRDPALPDNSSLRTVRAISNLDELYRQWTAYRLDVLSQRAALKVRDMDAAKGSASAEEIRDSMRAWVREQVAYLQTTLEEML